MNKTSLTVKFLLIFIISLLFPLETLAAPKSVYTDPETGHEVWQMTNWGGFEGPDYYTSPLFSPNGKYFVYHDSSAYPSYLSIMNADGTNKRTFGSLADQSGGGPAFGWWSNDSKYYYSTAGLYRINTDTNQAEQIPNAASALPFNFPMVSPDGKTLAGISNLGDTGSRGMLKFIDTDGTNYRSFASPVQPGTSGFDVTHGWVGNNYAWYLNDSVNDLYRDIIRVVDFNTGAYVGTLNAVVPDNGNTDWTGIFDHPTLSNEGYMVGGITGMVSGGGSSAVIGSGGWGRANTLLVNTSADISAKQFTGVVDSSKYPAFTPHGPQWNFSPDGKSLITYNAGSNCSTLTVYPVDKASSPFWLATYGPTSDCEQASGFGSYATWSPDSTKVIFGSQYQLPNRNLKKTATNDMDVYQVIVKKPDAPTNLLAVKEGSNNHLTFKPPPMHREIKEYEIYRSLSQNGAFEKIGTLPEVYTYLNAPSKIGTSETVINVDDTANFPNTGVIEISGLSTERQSELISYNGKTLTSFTGCTRGYSGTVAAEHYNDAFVWKYTGSHGYLDTYNPVVFYKVKSVEWSGLTSDFSTAVGVNINNPSPSPTPACPLNSSGDLDCSEKINALDSGLLILHWGQSYPAGDLNNSGTIDSGDLKIILTNWGKNG